MFRWFKNTVAFTDKIISKKKSFVWVFIFVIFFIFVIIFL